ncbi:aldehyde dehydrogenase [Streptomyces sp. NPDC004838]
MTNPHQPRTAAFGNLVDGQSAPAADGATFTSVNPTTGQGWARFALSTATDVDTAVESGHRAWRTVWRDMTPSERGRLLTEWGALIARDAEAIAEVESVQNGKVVAELVAQVTASEGWLRYYGGLADKIEGAVIPVPQQTVLNYTVREPLGVIAVILPWNSPTFHTVMAISPALAAGNTVVIKPSEVTSASALRLAELAVAAGIPPGVVNVVTGLRECGQALVDHPKVAKISFIGSVPAGRAVGAAAGRRLVTSTLELGGKSANIVFDDADIDLAEQGILAGIFAATGQTCIAGSRAYVHRSLYDTMVNRLVKRATEIVVGDPLAATTQMGPAATADQLAKNEQMVAAALDGGAELLTGGHRVDVAGFTDGFFYAPTILHNAGPDNVVMREEVFGPVLTITPFDDGDEVVESANGTPFGLAAGVWTRDVRRAHLMARRLEAGTVWINTYRSLAYNSPFGGFKDSGTGRNNGLEAMDQFLQTKSVWCELGTEPLNPFVIRV